MASAAARSPRVDLLGSRMGWNDSPNDQWNRELFEEQIEIIKKAWYNETFSHRGKHYTLPVDGLDDRGRPVTSLTLIPKPWKTRSRSGSRSPSPKTYHFAAQQGHRALFWMMSRPHGSTSLGPVPGAVRGVPRRQAPQGRGGCW